jgi:hypothetical protein
VSLNETRIDEHYLLVRALFVGVFSRRQSDRGAWGSKISATDEDAPKLSFSTSTKSSSKCCERVACCRHSHSSVTGVTSGRPAEWLWRSLAYGRRLPLRIAPQWTP